jgi:hypothetical protein
MSHDVVPDPRRRYAAGELEAAGWKPVYRELETMVYVNGDVRMHVHIAPGGGLIEGPVFHKSFSRI